MRRTALWEAMEQRWWQPLLQQDLCSKDRYGYDRYGKLELGIPLDRFGGFSKSRQELCYRHRMHMMLQELKDAMVTGKRSIEIAEQLMGGLAFSTVGNRVEDTFRRSGLTSTTHLTAPPHRTCTPHLLSLFFLHTSCS